MQHTIFERIKTAEEYTLSWFNLKPMRRFCPT